MSIERKYPHGPLDEGRLNSFENRLPAGLPDAYRSFLLEFNGANFLDSEDFDEVPGGTRLGCLFGLHDGPEYERLDSAHEGFKRVLPASLLVIGADPYGNYFALELGGDHRGAVLFLDHERLLDPSYAGMRIATSFTALLDRAGSDIAAIPEPASLEEALRQRDARGVKKLLEQGATAVGFVHRAVHTGSLEIVRLVLDHGGDPNERGGIGRTETPLFTCAMRGHADIAGLLIDRGADPNARCGQGGTAMELAEHNPAVLAILAKAGAEPTNDRLRAAVRRILR